MKTTVASHAKIYKTASVSTASPGRIVLMLFDGCLQRLARVEYGFGMESVVQRNEEIHNNLLVAQNILRELQVSLDMERGGDFSKTMYSLYDFLIEHLIKANVKKEISYVHEVVRLVSEVRDAWAQMLDEVVKDSPQ
jgi:flagellar protein FliS